MSPLSPTPLPRGERGCFGEVAARLCGAAAMLLGWRPSEFWDATPSELATALSLCGETVHAPDLATIEELKRRFPD